MSSSVTFAINSKKEVCAIQKLGGGKSLYCMMLTRVELTLRGGTDFILTDRLCGAERASAAHGKCTGDVMVKFQTVMRPISVSHPSPSFESCSSCALPAHFLSLQGLAAHVHGKLQKILELEDKLDRQRGVESAGSKLGFFASRQI